MSDRVVRSYNGSDGASDQASYPFKSVWMAHWMCTSCKSETKACGHVSVRYEEARQHNHDFKKHSLFRGYREVTEPKRVTEVNEGLSLTESSKKTRSERWEGQSFPMFNLPPKTSLAKQNQQTSTVHGGLLSESNPPAMLARTPADAWPLEINRLLPERQVKFHNFLENNSLAVSDSYQDEQVRSDSTIVPHQIKGGSTSLPPFMCREEEINHSHSFLAPQQHATNTNDYTFFAHEKNANSKFISSRSGGSPSRLNDVVFLEHDPATSSNPQQDFVGMKFQEVQNQSGVGLLPSHSSPPELTKLGKVYRGCYSLPSPEHSVQNMDTMRVCSTVDAKEGSSRGPPMFSNSSHHFQFTKKTEGNLSEGGQVFGQSTVSTQLKGKAFSGLLGFFPEYGLPVKSGQKLVPYRSSTDSGGEEFVREVKAPAVESSSETDIMGMDAFQENLLPGAASSPSNKHVERGKKSPASQSAFCSASKEIGGKQYTNFLDINQELPDLGAFASSAEERDASTSRTQSLDVEHLLSHSEQPANSKSNACPDGSAGLKPSSRWVKRLKLSASHSGYGTKSSKMGEASLHEKVNKFSNRIVKCIITSSQPTMGRFFGKEQMALDPNPTSLRNGESSSIDTARKGQNITLSHPWIRRWSHTGASQNIPEPVGVFPLQCSKETLDEFQKKRFPSIGAMALMGKAMSGFHPCEFTKKGSLVVWNIKGFS